MMSESKKSVPIRRFKEFKNTEAWEQRKVSELIKDIADGPFGSNLKVVHYTDEKEARIIQLSNIGEGGWQDENVRYTTFEHAKEIKRCIVEPGELVMAKMMPAGLTIERPNTDKMYVLSSDAVRIKINEMLIDTRYFLYMTKCNYFLNQINNDAQGSTRTRTSISKIRMMDIPVPSIQEQKRIGMCFQQLDNFITLHQRKLEKMKALKTAYLSEMFPAEGERKPKRRFKGFENAWEQRKLKQLANFTKGQGYSKSDLTDAGTPVILYGRLYTKYQSIISEVDTFVVPKIGSVYSTGKEVILPASGETAEDIARASAVVKSGVLLGGDLNIIYPNKNISTIFLALSISNGQQQKELAKKAQGKSVVHLHNGDLEGVTISYPCKEEQEKIESVFSNIDNLITLHQRNLEKLQNIKNAYLNEMFVGGEQ